MLIDWLRKLSLPPGGRETPIDPVVISLAGRARSSIESITGNTWFGPSQPLRPIAPTGTPPRIYDYPFAVNISTKPRGETGAGVAFAEMRALADNYDLLRLVIETRKDQLCKYPWTVRAKQKPGERMKDYNKRSMDDPVAQKIERFFHSPDGEHSWQQWLRIALEDVFVIDALTICPRRSIGGDVLALDVIDGATIKRLVDPQGRTPIPPDTAYQQSLKGLPALDLQSGLCGECMAGRSHGDGTQACEPIIYRPRNPRPNRLYGYSPVEQILLTVNLALRRQMSQLAYYTDGNLPEMLIAAPKDWTPDQLREIQDWFDAMAGDVQKRRRVRWIPETGSNGIHETKAGMLKDEMDEWLARMVCYAFSVPPTPFVKMMNRATSTQLAESAMLEGLVPLLSFMAETINVIIVKYFNAPEVEFAWKDEANTDAEKQSAIESSDVKTMIRSVDEVREERGLDPLGIGPMLVTASGVITLPQLLEQQKNPQPVPQPGQGNGGGGKKPDDKSDEEDEYDGDRPEPQAKIAKWDDSQHPRDEHGKFITVGALRSTKTRAFKGEQVDTKSSLSKQNAGKLGELITLRYLQQQGYKDARPLNNAQSNYAVDMVQDHAAIEIKTGLASNGPSGQQWRATIGQPGKAEAEWLKTAGKEEKAAWNHEKQEKILERKNAALKEVSRSLGRPVKAYTMTTILNHDTRTADIYKFSGFHLRIAWNSPEAQKAYVGSFKY